MTSQVRWESLSAWCGQNGISASKCLQVRMAPLQPAGGYDRSKTSRPVRSWKLNKASPCENQVQCGPPCIKHQQQRIHVSPGHPLYTSADTHCITSLPTLAAPHEDAFRTLKSVVSKEACSLVAPTPQPEALTPRIIIRYGGPTSRSGPQRCDVGHQRRCSYFSCLADVVLRHGNSRLPS